MENSADEKQQTDDFFENPNDFDEFLEDVVFEQFATDMFVFEFRKYYVFKNSEIEEYLNHLSKIEDKEPLVIGYVDFYKGVENLRAIPDSEYESVARFYLQLKRMFSGGGK